MLIDTAFAVALCLSLVLYARVVIRIMPRLGSGGADASVTWTGVHAARVLGVAVIMAVIGPVAAFVTARATGLSLHGAAYRVLVPASAYVLNVPTLFLIFKLAGGRGVALKALGFATAPLPRSLRLGLWLFLLFVPFQVTVPFLVERVWADVLDLALSKQKALEMLLTADVRVLVPTAFMAVIVAPFYEEIVFRGFVQQGIERTCGRGPAIVATSLLFAAIHLQGNSLLVALQILPVSLAFSVFYDRTRNIASNMFFHSLFNLSTIVAVLWRGTSSLI